VIADWEAAWAPYDDATYDFVVERIRPSDIALDIGAGDLRLARRLARVARQVYAVEREQSVLSRVGQASRPHNLIVVEEDALVWPFPPGLTVAVLLMRHCTREHFARYVARLIAVGCQRLITNARWRVGVEAIDFQSSVPYPSAYVGWYACACGAVGFAPGDPDVMTPQLLDQVLEVGHCPNCAI
jgi:hypothetical protein